MAKASLAKRKANPNSTYWKDKADTAWADEVKKVDFCEICGRTERQLNAHHIINRIRLRLRHDLSNGVCLCVRCHVFDPDVSPHLGLASQEGFRTWLETERTGQYEWFMENKDNKQMRDKTYKESYLELTKE